jgi:hypothetical protein
MMDLGKARGSRNVQEICWVGWLVDWFAVLSGMICLNLLVSVWWQNVQKWREVKNGECSVVKWSEDFWWIVCIIIDL